MSPAKSSVKHAKATAEPRSEKFGETLAGLIERDETKSNASWAREFAIDRHHLNKILHGKVWVGRKIAVKILQAFPHEDARDLAKSYLYDESNALQMSLSLVSRMRTQALIAPGDELDDEAENATLGLQERSAPTLDDLPPKLRTQFLQFLDRAKHDPTLLSKFAAMLKIVAT